MCESHCCEEMKEYLAFKAEQERPIAPFPTWDEMAGQMIVRYQELAKPYGGLEKCVCGEITNSREVYADNRIYATITYPIVEHNLKGTGTFEGVLEFANMAELAVVATRLHYGRTLVIDRESKQILEASIY